MKKLFILALMMIIGAGIATVSFADLQGGGGFTGNSGDSNRLIALKTAHVHHANTLVSGNGIDVFMITGVANSSNAVWVAYNVATIAAATNGTTAPNQNIMVEGGEATQYDALGPYNFGPDGLRFDTGLVVVTTTADLSIIYR